MRIFTLQQIGVIRAGKAGIRIELEPPYRAGLRGLEGFTHLNIFWWFHLCDNQQARSACVEARPYVHGPDVMGSFATRSPERPNPIALSCAGITGLDMENGIVTLDYIDAEDGSPVLDLKPYTPSLDRVEAPAVPAWCAEWPGSVEASGDFDWGAVFNF